MKIDLEAIRARNEARREFIGEIRAHEQQSAQMSGGFEADYQSSALQDDVDDVDALLAEVERWRGAANCGDCFMERYHGRDRCHKHRALDDPN